MPTPDADEVRRRVRAALSGYVLGVEQWAGMLLDEDDRMTDEEKKDYLIECYGTLMAYVNVMVHSYAARSGVKPSLVLTKLYETLDKD